MLQAWFDCVTRAGEQRGGVLEQRGFPRTDVGSTTTPQRRALATHGAGVEEKIMVRVCVFPNCTNKMARWTTVSFHRLPFHDLDLLKLWLVVLKLDPNSTVEALRRADHRVCSIHFAAEDFFPQKPRTEKEKQKRLRIHLMKNAIPRAAAGTADTMEVMHLRYCILCKLGR